jgi:hypothetical protein
MFKINQKWEASLNYGNTGARTIKIKNHNETVPLQATDKVYICIITTDGIIAFERFIDIDIRTDDDTGETTYSFTIQFAYEDSKLLKPGVYLWDCTALINPVIVDGKLYTAQKVDTPIRKKPFIVSDIASKEVYSND